MSTSVSLPAYLEIREDDGTSFLALSRVLQSPDKQARCVDQKELRRIRRLIEEDPGLEQRIHDDLEARMARVEQPDGKCYHCEQPAGQHAPFGPINIRISEPDEEPSEHVHEFCCWECFAHYAATQAGGVFSGEMTAGASHAKTKIETGLS